MFRFEIEKIYVYETTQFDQEVVWLVAMKVGFFGDGGRSWCTGGVGTSRGWKGLQDVTKKTLLREMYTRNRLDSRKRIWKDCIAKVDESLQLRGPTLVCRSLGTRCEAI